MTSYSIPSFLKEIRKHPELWDLNCEDYKYRRRRKQAWESIARILIADFEDMRDCEKEDMYQKLYGKWRNLRDSYVKQMVKGNAGPSYPNGKHLSFLKNVYKQYSTQIDGDLEIPHHDNSDSENDKPLNKPKKRRVKKKDISWSHEEDVPLITENLTRTGNGNMKQEESGAEDDDKSFFDSLIPAVREFDMDQKLKFRSQIISVIDNIRKSKKHNRNYN